MKSSSPPGSAGRSARGVDRDLLRRLGSRGGSGGADVVEALSVQAGGTMRLRGGGANDEEFTARSDRSTLSESSRAVLE
jgi:hypothetical protein